MSSNLVIRSDKSSGYMDYIWDKEKNQMHMPALEFENLLKNIITYDVYCMCNELVELYIGKNPDDFSEQAINYYEERCSCETCENPDECEDPDVVPQDVSSWWLISKGLYEKFEANTSHVLAGTDDHWILGDDNLHDAIRQLILNMQRREHEQAHR